jgi:peptidoglycan hydrolase-like protein with peptidoglycan-binding domain
LSSSSRAHKIIQMFRVCKPRAAGLLAAVLAVFFICTSLVDAASTTWSLDSNFTSSILQLVDTNTTSQNAVIYATPIATYNGNIYACYRDADFDNVIAKSIDGGTTWTTTVIAAGSTNDAHNTCSLGIDENGYIHVSYDHHAVPLKYRVSDNPEDISAFSAGTMTGTAETAVTYPRFYRSPAGVLYFIYRDGASGDGNLHLRTYDADTETWTDTAAPFIDGAAASPAVNPYENNLVWDSAGDIHLTWGWRETPAAATNHNLLYAKYDTSDAQWEKTDGTAYILPIDKAQAEVAATIAQSSGYANTNSNWVDSLNHPHAAYIKNATDGRTEVFHTTWNGTAWLTTQVTDLNPSTVTTWNLGRPQILIGEDDTIYIFFTDSRTANQTDFTLPASNAFYWTKSTDYGANWTSPVEITEFPKGGEFVPDYDYFRTSGDFRFLYQEIAGTAPAIYVLDGTKVVNGIMWDASTNIDADALMTGTVQLSCTPGSPSARIAQWKFEETSGDIVNTTATTTDLDGTAQGSGMLRGQTGQFGNAIYLPGTAYVSVANDDPLDFSTTRDFTIQAWIKATSTASGSTIVAKYAGGTAPGYFIDTQTGGFVRALIRDGVGSGSAENVSITGTTNVLDGNWHHIAARFDRGGNLSLYIDGVSDATPVSISTVTTSVSNANAFTIGARAGGANFFSGYIDDVSVSDGIIDPANFDFAAEHASECPFEDATFTTAYHDWTGQVTYSSLLVDSTLNSGSLTATVQTSADAFSSVESSQAITLSSGSNAYSLSLSGNGRYARILFSFDPSANFTPFVDSFTLSADADTSAPTITLNGDSTVRLRYRETYTELGAAASDNLDSSVNVTISGSVDTSTPGTYTVTYTAEDDTGNDATAVTRTVIVSPGLTGGGSTAIPSSLPPQDPGVSRVNPASEPPAASFSGITTNLRRGMQHAQIQLLQTLLALDPILYPERLVTGFFGELTEKAVQRFQARHNIVAEGTPATTGYGAVGPQTRAKLSEVFSVSASNTSSTSAATSTSFFTRTLSLLYEGVDVKKLQEFLNAHNFSVAESGPGSPGEETERFGSATRQAVIRFQEAYAAEILEPSGFTKGTGIFGPASLSKANEILTAESR